MSTTTYETETPQVTGTPEAADEQTFEAAIGVEMERITTDLNGAMQLLLFSAGTRSGLWQALAGAGPSTVEEVTARVSVDPALVREWLRSQAAAGYLTYHPEDATFTLGDAAEAVFVHGPGGPLVESAVEIVRSMTACFDDFAAAFSAGRGFGWHERTAGHWHATDGFGRIVLPADLIGAAVEALPGVPAALRAGGSVLDVGCGYGHPTMTIAAAHPHARVTGVDYHDVSVVSAREAGAASGLDNVRFEVAPATALPGGDHALITFFDSLHDIGDPLGALRSARSVLAVDGAVLLFEPLGSDRVEENFHPGGRMFYAVSTLACTPNAVSQRTPGSSEPLGAQAGEQALRAVAAQAGFGSVRRLDVPADMNLVLELRP